MIKLSAAIICITSLLVAATGAHGQQGAVAYPSKPVRILVGVSPGGASDLLARGVAQELSRVWGQPVLVENRPGAGDVVAATAVARAPADGYTLYHTGSGFLLTSLLRKLPFDPPKDLVPVIAIAQTSTLLVAALKVTAQNVQELVALARNKPGVLNYGSFGIGSAGHIDAEAFGASAGAVFTHIPYKGGADVINALLGGQVDFSFSGLTAALPAVRSGKLKALGYGGRQRSAALPQVPTLREAGYDFKTGGWFGWHAPSATPRAIIERISADASRVVAGAAFRDKYIFAVGMDELNLQATAAAELLKDDREKFLALAKTLNLQLSN